MKNSSSRTSQSSPPSGAPQAPLSDGWREMLEGLASQAYREGYSDGWVDGRHPEDADEALQQLDSIAISEGWSDSRARSAVFDAIAKATSHD